MKKDLKDYRKEMAKMQAQPDSFNKGVPVDADKRDFHRRSVEPVVWTKVQRIIFFLTIFAFFLWLMIG